MPSVNSESFRDNRPERVPDNRKDSIAQKKSVLSDDIYTGAVQYEEEDEGEDIIESREPARVKRPSQVQHSEPIARNAENTRYYQEIPASRKTPVMEDDTDDSNQEEDDYTLDLRSRMAKVREQEKIAEQKRKEEEKKKQESMLEKQISQEVGDTKKRAKIITVYSAKGGVGKTTLCGMLIQYLCEKGKGPILAVDADANSNLNEVLGVKVETTLGDVREEIARAELAKENPIPTGMSKADYAEMRFEDALVEDDDFDLLVMGRTQGKGCYCYVNGLLQTQLAKYQNNYPYIVVDNEAGMEHISRGVLPSMQTAILVSDCSRRGVQAVGRIAELIKECDMHPDTVGLIINRAPKGELNKGIQEEIANQGLTLLGVVPQDETVYEYDCEGRPTSTLPEDNPVKTALRAIVDNLKL